LPTTALGLLLFTVLLLPGFAFTLVQERTAPDRKFSGFRETVSLVFASVVANLVVLCIFAGIRIAVPTSTPDVGALVADPEAFARVHYRELAAWGIGMLLVATIGAAFVATPFVRERVRQIPALGTILGLPHEPFLSGWGRMFSEQPKARVYVGCSLEDGSYIGGYLRSWSRASDDLPDRDLTLTGSITYRAPGAEEGSVLPSVGGMIISARRIMSITVSYVEAKPARTDPR